VNLSIGYGAPVRGVSPLWHTAPGGFPAASFYKKFDDGSVVRVCFDYGSRWSGKDLEYLSYVSWIRSADDGFTHLGGHTLRSKADTFLTKFDGTVTFVESMFPPLVADERVLHVNGKCHPSWTWVWPVFAVRLGSGYKVSVFTDIGPRGTGSYMQVLPPWSAGDGVPRFYSAFTREVSPAWAEDIVMCQDVLVKNDPTVLSAIASASYVPEQA